MKGKTSRIRGVRRLRSTTGLTPRGWSAEDNVLAYLRLLEISARDGDSARSPPLLSGFVVISLAPARRKSSELGLAFSPTNEV